MDIIQEALEGWSYIRVAKPLVRAIGLAPATVLCELYSRYVYYKAHGKLDELDGFYCSPSVMEEELAISKKVLYTVIEKLKEKKLIKVEKRKGRGTIEVNYYYLQHGDIVKLLELWQKKNIALLRDRKNATNKYERLNRDVTHGTQMDPVEAKDPIPCATGSKRTPYGTQMDPVEDTSGTQMDPAYITNNILDNNNITNNTIIGNFIFSEFETKIIDDCIRFWKKVFFTLPARSRLLEEVDEELLKDYIVRIVNYCVNGKNGKGYKYTDYNLAIRNWIRKDFPKLKVHDEIKECYEIIKECNDGVIDGNSIDNYKNCILLLEKLKGHKKVVRGEYTRQELLQGVIIFARPNKYINSKITSARSLNDNLAHLLNTISTDVVEGNRFSNY